MKESVVSVFSHLPDCKSAGIGTASTVAGLHRACPSVSLDKSYYLNISIFFYFVKRSRISVIKSISAASVITAPLRPISILPDGHVRCGRILPPTAA